MDVSRGFEVVKVKSWKESRTVVLYGVLALLYVVASQAGWDIDGALAAVAIAVGPFMRLISATPVTTKSDLVGLSILEYLAALELPDFPLSPSHAAVVRVLSGADGRLTGEALHRAIGGLLPQLDQLVGELESHGYVARWSPSGSMVELAYELTEAGRRAAGMPGVYRLTGEG
jgi:hypothetical protein